jgi:signal-transduction protein with cAMP-binding, CBS, and nucleotidyltransferase domain
MGHEVAERSERLDEFARRLPSIGADQGRKTMIDRLFSRFGLGFGVGYVVGARAGRERYQQIQEWWNSFIGNPTVQQAAHRGRELMTEAGGQVASKIQTQRSPQDIREVMTAAPETVRIGSTLAEAAAKMKQQDAGAMVVIDESRKVVGIVTDRDIAIRAVAEGRDVTTTKVGDVASKDLQTLSPSDSVEDAVRLMRQRDIRRLPVVEDGRAVGIVSIGDLARERDPRSALADISRAPANQ